MTSETYNPADELRRIIAEGRISEDALQAITGLPQEKLRYLLFEATPGMTGLITEPRVLSNDESARLSILAAHVTVGLRIKDDERLEAIFESLTIECLLTPREIARVTGLDVDDLEDPLRDPRTVPIEKKHELAIKGSSLINAVNIERGARKRKTSEAARLNALIGIVSTTTSAPVIIGSRLGWGATGFPRGARRFVADILTTVQRMRSATSTEPMLLRADSAFYGHAVVSAAHHTGAKVSITARMDPAVKRTIATIP